MRGLRLLAVAGAIAAVNAVVTLALWLAGGDEFIPGLVGWGLRIMADNIIRDLAPALILMLPLPAVLLAVMVARRSVLWWVRALP